eukprot:CAMPEP_0196572752 /NCGR_PEP_ID=MMETSP1081-20130531/2740_1 /TAXON_ID=36882 /ORGANISM="Pyramimonas amylifera, Strain CCMP720" /LENGTH=164 /DNA_ID=CAMNT_0041890171 /DNA_START=27 /DNA_END=521 /DNA_ORIENTATION=-
MGKVSYPPPEEPKEWNPTHGMSDEDIKHLHEMHDACEEGDVETVKRYYDEHNISLEQGNEDSQCALHHACNSGNFDTVKFITDNCNRFCVNRKDKFGITPFHMACENGDLKIVEHLTKLEGFDANLKRNSAVFIAARHQHNKVVDFLMATDETGKVKMKCCVVT